MDISSGVQTADLLKKGKYGFYKQVDAPRNIYGEVTSTEPSFSETTPVTSSGKPVFDAFRPVSKNNHYVYPEKVAEVVREHFKDVLKPFTSPFEQLYVEKKEAEAFTTEELQKRMEDGTHNLKDRGKQYYRQLKEIYLQIAEDVETMANQDISMKDRMRGFTRLTKDILLLLYTATAFFNISSHPNIIDYMGAALTDIFVAWDKDPITGDMIDIEKARMAVLYFTLIAYAAVFIFVAYVASENWYYFLFYPYSQDIMLSLKSLEDPKKTEQVPFSLQALWYRSKKELTTLFGIFHPLFYVVTTIDTLFRRIRENWRGNLDHVAPFVRIGLFLLMYYTFMYWTTLTSSPVIEYIYVVVIFVSVLTICLTTHGSFGFSEPSPYYAAHMIFFVVTLIKFIVLMSVNTGLLFLSKLSVNFYILVFSFLVIALSEKNGFFGWMGTIGEMEEFNHLNMKMKYENDKTYTHFFLYILEYNWWSVSVFIIFFILFFSFYKNTNDVHMFMPIFYFICIFWGLSVGKIIINCFREFFRGKDTTVLRNEPPTPVSVAPAPNFADLTRVAATRDRYGATSWMAKNMPAPTRVNPFANPIVAPVVAPVAAAVETITQTNPVALAQSPISIK